MNLDGLTRCKSTYDRQGTCINMVKLNASPAMLDGTYSGTVTAAARLTLSTDLTTFQGTFISTVTRNTSLATPDGTYSTTATRYQTDSKTGTGTTYHTRQPGATSRHRSVSRRGAF